MWALIMNNKPQEFIENDPEGKYHPDIRFVHIPLFLREYITMHYLLSEIGFEPPSTDYLLSQFSQRINNKVKQLLAVGLLFENERYNYSFIYELSPHYVNFYQNSDPESVFYYQDKYNIAREITANKAIIIYNALLKYQQRCLAHQKSMLIELGNYMQKENSIKENLENTIKFANDFIETGWPSSKIEKEKEQ